jgi:SPP1 gp7 family putative phage head morphogenesis protein
MGLLDLLIGRSGNPNTQTVETKNVRGVEVKVVEVGTPGTEIFGGYLAEEYLKELTGTDWADKVDMMRRSDANVRMVLNAIKLPLKSSPWTIVLREKSDEAELQKKLFEKILFEDLNKSFTQLVGEILTCLDFGYSIFDITHAVKTDKELGTYNSLKSLGYRSQRTIDRWNLNDARDLETVTQTAYGDEGGTYELDARFLLYFAPEREGDNFEGISVLRACYGPWFRKNEFLKKLAIGIEKFAVPTAVLTVPEGTEGKPEMSAAKKALACYTSGQTNYLILPKGFELSFNNVSVDVEKIRSAINAENQEMVNSILASFLLLGQNGSGSLALSGTLSDFFSQTVQYIADHISEQFDRKIFKPLVQMNFGHEKVLVDLKCDGLEHRANETWANMVSAFISSGAIKPDEDLEVNLREKLNLPPKKVAQTEEPQVDQISQAVELAEKKKTKEPPQSTLIRDTADRIRMAGQGLLPAFAKKYARSILIQKNKASASDQIKAPIKATVPGLGVYQSALTSAYMIAKIEADEIQGKAFKGTKKTLSEFRLGSAKLKRVTDAVTEYEDALLRLMGAQGDEEIDDAIYALGRISDKVNLIFGDYLTPAQKKAVSAKVEVFSDTQKNDVVKAIDLQYQNSLVYTDNDEELDADMMEAGGKAIAGPMTTAGPDVQASQVVNDGLLEAAEKYAEETGDQIISYTYVAKDDDRTTEICREMDGTTFSADDPNVTKFSPPLHFNCRSFMQVNTSTTKNNPKVTGLPKLSKVAQGQMQFAEYPQSKYELAEYQGRKVELEKPFRTTEGPKKFGVYVKNDKGNIVLVRFGDPKMDIKRDDLERRRNFRARHQCDTDPGPKWKARYWSCKFWSSEKVGDLV